MIYDHLCWASASRHPWGGNGDAEADKDDTDAKRSTQLNQCTHTLPCINPTNTNR